MRPNPFSRKNPFRECDPSSCLTQKHLNEIETLLSIQQAITRQLGLQDVLQMIADETLNLTSARMSFVYILVGDELELAAVSGYEYAEKIIGSHIPIASSLAGQSIKIKRPLMINNLEENDTRVYYEALKPFGKIGCYFTIPLLFGDSSIGAITVIDQCDKEVDNDSLRVLSMLAPSAVIGIENARLYQEQQERRLEAESRHQMAEGLRVMLAILNSNRSLSEILDYIVKQVSSHLLDCQATAIFALQPKDKTLFIQASHGLSPYLVDTQFIPGYDAASLAIKTKQPVTISNVLSMQIDDQSMFAADSVEWAITSQLIVFYKAWIAVPLVVKGESYGAILMYYHDPHEFSKEEINLALMFSDHVALAIENARLKIQAEQAAVIAERNRLARELHDAVSQTLFSANLIAEVLPRLWEIDQEDAKARLLELRQLTRGARAEMRTLLFELRPSVFKEAMLGDLLKHLTQAIEVRSGIPITITALGEYKFPPEIQIALYRITQEALNNVVKHANPTHAFVELKSEPESITLTICDDGCGFNPDTVSSEHFGLSIMQERAASIKATLQVISQPKCGTQIKVIWSDPTPKEKQR
jgi:signal transduction histidine kinase